MTTAERLDREALVTVKAYPTPSTKYIETTCVAAITSKAGKDALQCAIPLPM